MGEAQLSAKDEQRAVLQLPHNHSGLDAGGGRKQRRKKGINYLLDESMAFSFQAFTPIPILLRKVKKYKSTIMVTFIK